MSKMKYLLPGILVLAIAFRLAFFGATRKEGPKPAKQEITLQSDGSLQIQTIYSLCNHHSVKKQVLLPELVGLTKIQVQKLHPEWEIIRFEPEILEVRVTLEALDEQCASRRYLGLYQGRVAVFRGMPGRGVMEELTAIRVENLPASEVEALTTGLEVVSDGQILEILEGLAEGQAYEELE